MISKQHKESNETVTVRFGYFVFQDTFQPTPKKALMFDTQPISYRRVVDKLKQKIFLIVTLIVFDGMSMFSMCVCLLKSLLFYKSLKEDDQRDPV